MRYLSSGELPSDPRLHFKLALAMEVKSWTYGSAVDILESKGVQAMMKHGEWASETSAHASASLDEVDTQKLKSVCTSWPDLSEDDS